MHQKSFKTEENILNLECYHELSLLKCILVDNSLIFTAKTMITADDFIKQRNKEIFRIMDNAITNLKEKVDFVSLANYIQEHETNLSVLYLTDICEAFATTSFLNQYLLQVKANATKRKLLDFSFQLNELNNLEGSFKSWIDEKNSQFKDIIKYFTKSKLTSDIHHPSQYAAEAINYYTDKSIPRKPKIKTGFDMFDEASNGLSTLTILSAPTGKGKTTFALNVFVNLGHVQKIPCLYINYEMEKEKLLDRITCIITGIEDTELENKEDKNIDLIVTTYVDIQKNNSLILTGNEGKTVNDTCSLIYQNYNDHGIKVVFIDYVGEIEPDEQAFKERSEYITYGRYAQTIKNLCAELGIKCFMVAQISREGDEEPKRKHIQGSWKLIQKADLFCILCEEEEKDEKGKKIPNSKKYKLKIEKNRHGICPLYINLDFNKKIHLFTESIGF